MFYCPGLVKGHIDDLELFCLFLYDEAGLASVQLELLLYPDHVVVGQPHYTMMVCAPVPHRRTEEVICASGSFWLGD